MTIRVVLVDDHAPMREAFRTILAAHAIDVVGEAGDGAAAVDVITRTRPDVVLMDVRMPHQDGIAATRAVVSSGASSRVLMLTTFNDDAAIDSSLHAGASGFLLKNSTPEELVAAIRRVAGGDVVLDPAITRRVLGGLAGGRGVDAVIERLTEREKDVLALLTEGMTNAEIAARLGTGEATVKTHVSRVLMKLDARDRVQAVIRAYETGFVAAGHRIPPPPRAF